MFCYGSAYAQSRGEAYFALGTAQDGSTNQLVDLLGTGNYMLTQHMGGVFGTLGGGIMIKPTLGAGAEVSFRFTQGNYAGLGYRPIFYDFNGIWAPSVHTKRVQPEILAGFGGVSLRFYGGTQYLNYYTGTYSNYAGSNKHFQLHAGLGLRVFIKPHLFVRPQIDYRWVPNLNLQFASDSVLAYSLAIGYSFSQ
jgi:hypothetical protein